MMLPYWCCHHHRFGVTVILWATTLAAITATTSSGKEGVGEGGTAIGGGGGVGVGVEGEQAANPPSALIQKLEKNLMAMFGIQQRPRVKRQVTVPPYMMELYQRQAGLLFKASKRKNGQGEEAEEEEQEEEEEEIIPKSSRSYSTNTVRSFAHKESTADSIYPHNRMRFHFNVSNIPADEVLYNADLRLTHTVHASVPSAPQTLLKNSSGVSNRNKPHKKKKWSTEDVPYLHRIMVYDILRRATKNSEPTLRLLDTKVIDARKGGVQKLDVYEALKRWIEDPKKNFGLLVDVAALNQTAEYDTSHVHLRRHLNDSSWHEKQPLLVTYTDDSKAKSRSKRTAPVKHKKTKNYCKRYPLYVDFRKVGWDDWIVAPPGYEAYFCKGDCPFPLSEDMNATNHAVVQTLVNSRYPDRVPKACCVPTELSAISMLYMDDDEKFVLKNHQDMVVEGCGCR